MFQMRFGNIEDAKKYVLSDEVTGLPLSAQALYLQIILNGIFKEEKVLNIKSLARAIGASAGDVRLLTDEKFYKEVKGVAGEDK